MPRVPLLRAACLAPTLALAACTLNVQSVDRTLLTATSEDITALTSDLTAAELGDAGVAPFVVAGARVFVAREVSLGVQSGLHVVASDLWATNTHLVPRGAVVWSGGLALGVHL